MLEHISAGGHDGPVRIDNHPRGDERPFTDHDVADISGAMCVDVQADFDAEHATSEPTFRGALRAQLEPERMPCRPLGRGSVCWCQGVWVNPSACLSPADSSAGCCRVPGR